ncbi:Protein kinase C-like, phorbol ester/diacylglycerol binding protein [Corchorus olitorius]|uniref:Protein kinase C-like, phorbol ester/diacylglycerol binding protein n=1 Tax=Corchorus olitorius TaxID=93759 RepID=A0A1R3JQ44_9ROSI|nr:Protein kinase C-like, phorbol ester/diacylglycerol binding protein [Corchorus olitorius]
MELQHFSHPHPLVFNEKPSNENDVKAKCLGCGEVVSGPSFSCVACKFYLDQNCAEAPFELAHPFHRNHKLELRKKSGDVELHEKCISFPRIIRISRHRHSLSHTFMLGQQEINTVECKICPKELNAQHGSYCCSTCKYTVHTNCGQEESSEFIFDEMEEMDEQFNKNSAFSVIKETNLGEEVIPTEINHLSHQHNLLLSDDLKDEKFCDGCMMFISTAFYHCSECNFFLHKSCAESPRKIYCWFLVRQHPCSLVFNRTFSCNMCGYGFNYGFAYDLTFIEYDYVNSLVVCLRCALISDTPTCGGHEHRLTFYLKYEGQCRGCGEKLNRGIACKDCNFLVDVKCLMLPETIRRKCDEHLLKLTYGDRNVYSEHNFCDICEERRNPELWFYYCAICDNSFHPKCVVGKYSFLKLGLTYKFEDHPHQLIVTEKVYDYPNKCYQCDEPCQLDAALECVENGCDYICHWNCAPKPSVRISEF